MKKRMIFLLTLFTTIVTAMSQARAEVVPDVSPYFHQSREAVKVLGTTLKNKLMLAMKNSGPEAAIAVCNTEALSLTHQVSREKGLTVSRTSLKYRNPVNAPGRWEQRVLTQFQERADKGESLQDMEFGELVSKNNELQFRYMKAIPTGKPCLTCHGTTIATELKDLISAIYPDDEATDYRAGELRGAFSVIVPVSSE
ncbi:MAG: DUF3365 domain-containing protein [bacterium]|nr:DUF3365 domain-containing protein [Gammaproteobacteria bacterium]